VTAIAKEKGPFERAAVIKRQPQVVRLLRRDVPVRPADDRTM
jgi:hypothetical protein